MIDDASFALCLTHDVDRPYKTYQSAYYALADRDPYHLTTIRPGRNPYWQFEDVMAIERELGVRSAFYFLDEQRLFRDKPVRTWLRPSYWQRYAGRYSLTDPAIEDVIKRLDDGGWEVGLHGSYDSSRDVARLGREKAALEAVLGHPVVGGRQHYLNLEVPTTWRRHAAIGLKYDATLGARSGYGFQFGYDVLRPFDDAFVVFPLTLMETRLPDVTNHPDRAWRECDRLLDEAHDQGAVMTVLWHPRYFSERDFPGYRSLYRRLLERALELGAWVGPPAELYAALEPDTVTGGTDAQADPLVPR